MLRRAAVAVLLRDVNRLEILLVKRKTRPEDPWSGQIALPGGMQKEKEYLLQTAIRETKEETGISLTLEELIGILEPANPKNKPEIEVVPFVFFISRKEEPVPGEEIEFCSWVPLEELLKNRVNEKLADDKIVPACTFEGIVVWGMTFRILLALFEFLKDLRILA